MEPKRISRPCFSLRFKVILVLILLHSILISSLIFYTISGHHRMVEDLIREHYAVIYSTFTPLLTEAVQKKELDFIRGYLAQQNNNPEIIYAAIFDENNRLLDKEVNPEFREQFQQLLLERKEERPVKVISREIGHPDGFFHREGHFFDFIIPLYKDKTYFGKVQLGITTARANQRLAGESIKGIQIIVGTILAGMLVIFWIDRRLKKILTHLISVTRKLADGNLAEKVDVRTGDEIEVLGNAFNIMAEAIRNREAVILEHKNHLEGMVTARTKELAEERDKLRAILDHVPSAIIMLDKELKIQMVNARFESLVNKPAADILGRPCTQEVSCWCNPLSCRIGQCLEDGEIKSRIIHQPGDSLSQRHLEEVAVPLLWKNKIYGVLEIITDVSDEFEIQNQIIRAEKLATTGEFAALLAHEVRNSLTSVKMILQLFLEKVEESHHRSIRVALNSISQMEDTVNNLLRFAPPVEVRKSRQDLHQLLRESVELARHQFKQKPIEVDLDFDADMPMILIDKDNMEKVFINLFINAAQAIADSGSITITTRKTVLSGTLSDFASLPCAADGVSSSAAIQKIMLREGEPVVVIKISDTGPGIPRANITRIFDPFFTTKPDGTGLGLSLAKRVVNAHSGIITARNGESRGSTFTIYFPLKATA